MGTSIEILFPRPPLLDRIDFTQRLNNAFDKCEFDLQVIQKHAWYSFDRNSWNVECVPPYQGEPEYLFAEGPFGFDIHIYANTVCLGQLERFGRLRYDDSPVAAPLQRVLTTVVEDLAGSESFACVAGGMGDSDGAIDIAHYQASTFSHVLNWLRQSLGQPAPTWAELNRDAHKWALIVNRP